MTRQEEIGYRSTKFSEWHRKLPNYCCTQDIDFIEYRFINGELKIVALFEIKGSGDNPTKTQLKLYHKLSKTINCPAYVVYHNEDLSKWKIAPIKNTIIETNEKGERIAKEVWRIEKNEKGIEFGYPYVFKEFTEKEMIEFIKNL